MDNDIRIKRDFLDHPKIIKLQKKLGAESILCLIRLWGFTSQYRSKGILTKMTWSDIEMAAKWTGDSSVFIETLLELSLLDRKNKAVIAIHDWKDHNSYSYYQKERSARSTEAIKARWHKRDNNLTDTNGKNILYDDYKKSNSPFPSPSPSPFPSPSPDPKERNTLSSKPDDTHSGSVKKEKEEIPYSLIIDDLNKQAGTNYKSTTSKTRVLIKARWAEGFQFENFQRVHENKCEEWLNTDMAKYLRPETLYGTKFEGYLNQQSSIEESFYYSDDDNEADCQPCDSDNYTQEELNKINNEVIAEVFSKGKKKDAEKGKTKV